MWRYDHCEFFKFQKSAINPGVPIQISFPEISDAQYDFNPRPLDTEPPEGPITGKDFYDRFYECWNSRRWNPFNRCNACSQQGHCHAWSQYVPLQMGICPTNEALNVLPKRKEALRLDNGKREVF